MSTKRISPLLIGLFVSVALNGILLGFLFADNKSPESRKVTPRGPNGTQAIDIGNIARALPQEQRERFTQALSDEERKAIQDVFREHNRSQRELGALIHADELDISALKLALSDIRDRRKHISLLGDEKLIDFLASLSVDERQALVLRLNSRRGGNNDILDGRGQRSANVRGDNKGNSRSGDGQRADMKRPSGDARQETPQ